MTTLTILASAEFVFFAVIIIVAIISLIMLFHWHRYGLGNVKLVLAETIYLSVTVLLIVATFLNLPQ